jgi:hypothetical protein
MDSVQRTLLKSEAVLDQFWAEMELIFSPIIHVSRNGVKTEADQSVAKAVCALVSYEINVRVLQRDHWLRVLNKRPYKDGKVIVEINAVAGHVYKTVPEQMIRESGEVKVNAYRLPDNFYNIVFPGEEQGNEIVSADEVTDQ